MRIRLKATAFIDGHIRHPGDIVTLPAGVKGPVRIVQKSHDRIDYGTNPPVDANRILGQVEEVPLYDELPDEPEAHDQVQQEQADIAAKTRPVAVEVKPAPVELAPIQPHDEVRTVTHIEERERR